MTDMPDLDTPIDVLMWTRGQGASDEPNGPVGIAGSYLSRVPDVPSPPDMLFGEELQSLLVGEMPGSLRGRIPHELYVFSLGGNPDAPLDMAQLHFKRSMFVVSDRVKRVLETLTIRNSEFYPVSMVYSNKGNTSEDWGGGPVTHGTHWLWWCYATYDLIDVTHSQAVLHPKTQPNRALPGEPSVSYHKVGQEFRGPQPNVALKSIPYAESAAFMILGWPHAGMIVSPDFVEAFTRAGLIRPDGPVLINFTPLNGPRFDANEIAFDERGAPRKAPLRIFGTDILAADRYDPPFYSRRSHLHPLPVRQK